jgi:hypothetical protein
MQSLTAASLAVCPAADGERRHADCIRTAPVDADMVDLPDSANNMAGTFASARGPLDDPRSDGKPVFDPDVIKKNHNPRRRPDFVSAIVHKRLHSSASTTAGGATPLRPNNLWLDGRHARHQPERVSPIPAARLQRLESRAATGATCHGRKPSLCERRAARSWCRKNVRGRWPKGERVEPRNAGNCRRVPRQPVAVDGNRPIARCRDGCKVPRRRVGLPVRVPRPAVSRVERFYKQRAATPSVSDVATPNERATFGRPDVGLAASCVTFPIAGRGARLRPARVRFAVWPSGSSGAESKNNQGGRLGRS